MNFRSLAAIEQGRRETSALITSTDRCTKTLSSGALSRDWKHWDLTTDLWAQDASNAMLQTSLQDQLLPSSFLLLTKKQSLSAVGVAEKERNIIAIPK
jgi:hypothetical protein